MFKHKHLISISELSTDDIVYIMNRADEWASYCMQPFRQNNALSGLSQINVFFEPSTRTQVSFELAGKQLGAYVTSLNTASSSAAKGETFEDAILTLNAMMPHVMILRHSDEGAARRMTELVDCSVINAGTGTGDHPTQALLDAQTIRQYYGRFEGLKVAICGDIKHSRVAASNVQCLTKLGVEVRLVGPPSLLPTTAPDGVAMFDNIDEGITGVDVVMMLRSQWERMGEDTKYNMMSELRDNFKLTTDRFKLTAPGASIMHPGPINRGSEIDADLAYGEASLILHQVRLGISTRMACLDVLTEGLRHIED